jgi:hypothetical protein
MTVASTTPPPAVTEVWGPLATPTHESVPHGDGKAAWKDNAYIAFWDTAQDAFGILHVSTSPNAEGRRARLSLSVGGIAVEVVEELEPASYRSESIEFDLSGSVTVDHPDLKMSLQATPRLAVADYSINQVIPPMNGAPVEHFQVTVDLTGRVTIKGHDAVLNATGIRDRTWGYRDESINIKEYFWFFGTFEDFSVTAMTFYADDVPVRTDGFVLRADGTQTVVNIGVVRDASGLAAEIIFTIEGGDELRLRSQGRRGGFWIPMSWERRGPAMSAYDEFAPFTLPDGSTGFGVAEHGTVRQLY